MTWKDLGPPYQASFATDETTPSWRVHQIVYPYAKGGPWVRTLTDQMMGPGGGLIWHGWWRATGDAGFLPFLVRVGFPRHAPAYTAPTGPIPAGAAGTSLPSPSGSWPAWAWALLASALLAAVLFLAARQRGRIPA